MTEKNFELSSDLDGLSLKILPHGLRPVPKLSQEMFSAFMSGMGGKVVYINGYGYLTTVAVDGVTEEPRTPLPLDPPPIKQRVKIGNYTHKNIVKKFVPRCMSMITIQWK